MSTLCPLSQFFPLWSLTTTGVTDLTLDLGGEVVSGVVVVSHAAIRTNGPLTSLCGYGHHQEGDKEQEGADRVSVVLAKDALSIEGHGLGPTRGFASLGRGRDGDALSSHN